MKRPTIADIAVRAGVTKAAVSFALNGQPGVSAATRERILAIADEIGFQPSSAARALTAGRAGAFGLIIDRPARMLGIEPFFMQVISGIQADLTQHHITLQFAMAEDPADEIELYRQWWAERRVDGVFVYDLRLDDTRISALESLRMPAVVIGSPRGSRSLPAVWQDERAVVSAIVGHLAELGHTRIARVGGLPQYWHTALRASAFTEVAAAFGVELVHAEADYTAEHGAAATSSLLAGVLSRSGVPGSGSSGSGSSGSGSSGSGSSGSGSSASGSSGSGSSGSQGRPTAIVYDNDVMAVAGLSCATRLGFEVPSDVSIVSWDDSALCELTNPPLTAMGRDIAWIGSTAARLLRSLVGGEQVASVMESAPGLVIRGSTGPA